MSWWQTGEFNCIKGTAVDHDSSRLINSANLTLVTNKNSNNVHEVSGVYVCVFSGLGVFYSGPPHCSPDLYRRRSVQNGVVVFKCHKKKKTKTKSDRHSFPSSVRLIAASSRWPLSRLAEVAETLRVDSVPMSPCSAELQGCSSEQPRRKSFHISSRICAHFQSKV